MSIISSELKWYKSETVTNTSANGGKMSTNEIVDGIKNNIFADVSQADRLSGKIFYRKVFGKLTNATSYPSDLEVLINPVFHLKTYTPGQDRVEMFITASPHTDTQADILGTEDMYGAGVLTSDVTAGATSFAMTLEDASQVIYTATGNCVYISDGTNQEYHTNVDASKSGDTVTFTLQTPGDVIANSYTAATPTLVATCYYGTLTELTPTFDALTATTAGDGDYTASGNLVGNNIGAVEDTYTITFDNADNISFTCTNSAAQTVGTGNKNSDFQPTNTDFSVEYFTLPSAGWTGTWAQNDTLTIPAHPASQGIWLKQTVPAGCNSYSGNNFYLRFGGESA